MDSTSRVSRAASLAAAALTVVLVLVGCVQPSSSPVGTYHVTAIYAEDGQPVPLLAGTAITLELTADGRLSGRACNSYGGSWSRTERGGFRIGDLYSTDMACLEPEGVMAQETRYLQQLGKAAVVLHRGSTSTFGTRGEPSAVLFEATRQG